MPKSEIPRYARDDVRSARDDGQQSGVRRIRLWSRIRAMFRRGEDEQRRTRRLCGVEGFRRQLVQACGEEPTVFMGMEAEVTLSDYLGTVLQARSGAAYWRRGEEFHCLAEFGLPAQGRISRPSGARDDNHAGARDDNHAGARDDVSVESPLPLWLAKNGQLHRPDLSLAGLSADEAEMLVAELDRLDAWLISPVVINEELWGFLCAGPGAAAGRDAGEELYLSLFAVSLAQCISRRRMGLPAQAETEARRQAEALKQAEQLWTLLRTSSRHLRLAVLDTEEEAARSVCRFFDGWGFETSQGAAGAADLLLRVQRDRIWLEGPAAGIRQRLPKPCRFAVLARWVFEAAAAVAIRPEETESGRRCLLVDEDREANQALQEYFRAKGCRVWGVASAEEAVPVALRVKPELVLVDLKLPQPEGAEWVGRIRRASPQSRVVVMAPGVGDYHSGGEIPRPGGLGMTGADGLGMTASNEVLVKPVKVERLGELLHA